MQRTEGKKKHLTIRTDKDWRELIQLAARLEGFTVSDFIRRATESAAKKVVRKQQENAPISA